MWAADRYFAPRFWNPRYWFKTGSDIAHTLTATVWLVPERPRVNASARRGLQVSTRPVLAVDRRRHG
jgi:hypothetical protein